MIYTVTFNPSLDYIVSVNDFEMGMTNRTESEMILPGGKGINVSIVLKNLGLESTTLGFVAGFTGQEISRRLTEFGVSGKFIQIDEGISRINVKIKNIDGTEINGAGPQISKQKVEELFGILEQLKDGDVLVLAGSIPASLSDHIYEEIMESLAGKDIQIVVDATSSLLMNVLQYRPFLIKPNHHELGEIFGVKLSNRAEVIPYAKELQQKGARNVLISMGGMGAVLVAESGEVYEAPAPAGEVKNSVGAGDSMVAGFVAGWLNSGDYEEAFKRGIATGSASAFSDNLATAEEVQSVYANVMVNNVSC